MLEAREEGHIYKDSEVYFEARDLPGGVKGVDCITAYRAAPEDKVEDYIREFSER